jgi:hypothetical protein
MWKLYAKRTVRILIREGRPLAQKTRGR